MARILGNQTPTARAVSREMPAKCNKFSMASNRGYYLNLQGRFQLYYVLIPGDVFVDAKDVHFPWVHWGGPSAEAKSRYNWD